MLSKGSTPQRTDRQSPYAFLKSQYPRARVEDDAEGELVADGLSRRAQVTAVGRDGRSAHFDLESDDSAVP